MNFLSLFVLGLLSLSVNARTIRPAVIFDLDHALLDTNARSSTILRELAVEFEIPELLAVSSEQIDRWRQGDEDALGLRHAADYRRVFGSPQHVHRSPFGRRFYHDVSYVKYDGLVAGAPEFVARLIRELDADVYYLSHRPLAEYGEATARQLTHWGFPGYEEDKTTARVDLLLRPRSFVGSADAFKLRALNQIMSRHPVVAVFDGSVSSINRFVEKLPEIAPVVRIAGDVGQRVGLHPRVEQITNFVYNSVRASHGDKILRHAINEVQLDTIVMRARQCAARLL